MPDQFNVLDRPVSVVAAITGDNSVANSAVETTVLSYMVPANSMVVGTTYEILLMPRMDNIAVSGTFTVKIKLGATTLLTAVSASQAGAQLDQAGRLDALVTCRSIGAAGTVAASSWSRLAFDGSIKNALLAPTVPIDTTAANLLAVTVQWQTADPGNVFRTEVGRIKS